MLLYDLRGLKMWNCRLERESGECKGKGREPVSVISSGKLESRERKLST